MIKVKEFSQYMIWDEDEQCFVNNGPSIDEQINSFVEENNVLIIDIKYCVNFAIDGDNESQVLLIYRERG